MMRSFLFTLSFLAFLVLPVASAQAVDCPANFYPQGGVCMPGGTGLSDAPVTDILMTLLNGLLGLVAILGILAFVISGIQYLVSAGDEKLAETAKHNMTYAIIGIIVALSGWIVIRAINTVLSGWLFGIL